MNIKVNELHNEAMRLAELAAIAKINGNRIEADSLLHSAFESERKAAMFLMNSLSEPTRTILFRSAASLAIDCGYLCKAEELIDIGLSGNPPREIAEELKNLSERIKNERCSRC